MQPLVSVIVPTYNRPEKLVDALESIDSQSYDHLELVVVDDSSDADMESVVDDIDADRFNRIAYIEHEENRGGNAARVSGIESAGGDYIAFLDDDDKWLPEKIERQVTTFQEAPDSVGLVYTGTRNENINRVDEPELRGEVGQEILLRNFVGTFSSVMVSADVIDDVGLPDERFPCDQDWEWYVRIGQQYVFEYISDVLVERGGATGEYDQVSADIDLKAQTVPLFINKYEDKASEYGMWFARKWRAAVLFRVCYIAFMNDRYDLSRRFGLQAIRYNPFVWRYYVTLLLTLLDRPLKVIYKRLPLRARRTIGQAIRFGNN